MRGTVSKEQLQFDPKIEKIARRNNAKAREENRLARLAQQAGFSVSIPTTSSSIPRGSPQSSTPSSPGSERVVVMELEDEEPQNALLCWTSPRRLARIGRQNTKQIEMKSGTIQLVTHHPFSGLDHEDPYKHLTTFYGLAGTLGASADEEETVFARLFPHSLIGKAKEWYLDQSTDVMTNWNALEKAFQERFFPEDRLLEAKTAVTTFNQGANVSLCEAWDHYKSLLRNCPKHGFDNQMQIHLFHQGLKNETKVLLDASAGGGLMLKTPFEGVKIIDQMTLTDRKTSHNQSLLQRKAGILELESSNALLAQNKLLTQQIEALQKGMKDMPKQILEQFQKEGGFSQVNACELCFGDHPTGFCPPPCEEEVNFVGNQQNPNQQAGSSNQGQYPGNSNQGRYPSNNNNFPRGNQYGQPWRAPPNYYYPPPPNYYQPPPQNRPQSTD